MLMQVGCPGAYDSRQSQRDNRLLRIEHGKVVHLEKERLKADSEMEDMGRFVREDSDKCLDDTNNNSDFNIMKGKKARLT